MKRRWFTILGILLPAAATAWIFSFHPRPPRSNGPLPQQAYIWQRAWTPEVHQAAVASARSFAAYVVLAGEVSFRSQHLEFARAGIDYASLEQTNLPIGLALRIGPYRGSFAADDANTIELANLASSLVERAKSAGVTPAELQIDFDCAESKLDAYRLWVRAIRQRVAPLPVTITALPSWLKEPAFIRLSRDSDGYVLQVHSLERPRFIDAPMTLCDPAAAHRAVESAGRLGIPFRVALPTYSYLVAFNDKGRFEGISAEGSALSWPAGAQLRILRADPGEIAGLVSAWSVDRPRCMMGLIWYRLPAAGDALNWKLATLQAVMAGRVPQPEVVAQIRRGEPNLLEIDLVNQGEADAPLLARVVVRWEGADLLASDALEGFDQSENENQLTIDATAALAHARLSPGERRAVAWLRLSDDKEVVADVFPLHP